MNRRSIRRSHERWYWMRRRGAMGAGWGWCDAEEGDTTILDWLQEHRELLIWIGASLLLGLLALAGTMVFIVRVPPDFFARQGGAGGGRGKPEKQDSGASLALRIGKNVLGWALIIAGVAMLALPGPGVMV